MQHLAQMPQSLPEVLLLAKHVAVTGPRTGACITVVAFCLHLPLRIMYPKILCIYKMYKLLQLMTNTIHCPNRLVLST